MGENTARAGTRALSILMKGFKKVESKKRDNELEGTNNYIFIAQPWKMGLANWELEPASYKSQLVISPLLPLLFRPTWATLTILHVLTPMSMSLKAFKLNSSWKLPRALSSFLVRRLIELRGSSRSLHSAQKICSAPQPSRSFRKIWTATSR